MFVFRVFISALTFGKGFLFITPIFQRSLSKVV